SRCLGGSGGGQPGLSVRLGCIEESRTQLGEDRRARSGWSRQGSSDSREVVVDGPKTGFEARLGHEVAGRAPSRVVTVVENSRQLLRCSASARRPAAGTW